MGIVPNLVTGVWTGANDRSVHFKYIAQGQGASMALPIWAIYMKKCYADKTLNISKQDFERPEDINILLDCNDSTLYDNNRLKNNSENEEDLNF